MALSLVDTAKDLFGSNGSNSGSKTGAAYNNIKNFFGSKPNDSIYGVKDENFKDELYSIFFQSQNYYNQKNDPEVKSLYSAPFSAFDRVLKSETPVDYYYNKDTGRNTDIKIGGTSKFRPTFINNNRGFLLGDNLPTNTRLGNNDINTKDGLNTINLKSINYFNQNLVDESETDLIKLTASLSKNFHEEIEKKQRDMFDVSTRNICTQFSPSSSKLKSMALIPQDFAFIKDAGKISNNRLMVLRRYPYPVGNNPLLSKDRNPSPIATLLAYKKDTDWISFSLYDVWEKMTPNLDLTKITNYGGGVSKDGMDTDTIMKVFGDSIFNNTLLNSNLKSVNSAVNIAADPGLIAETMFRKSLESTISFEFKETYKINFYPGYDIENIFLDIMSNIMTMTSSDRVSLFQPQDIEWINIHDNFLKSHSADANIDAIFQSIQKVFKSYMSNTTNSGKEKTDKIKKINSDATKTQEQKIAEINALEKEEQNIANRIKSFGEQTNKLLKDIISRVPDTINSKYELALKANVSALTGLENAPYHLTIGNPMRPIISIGNLVITSANVSLKGDLLLGDIPSEIEVNITLKPATPLGKQDFENILNCGIGRIYNNSVNRQDQSMTRVYNSIPSKPNTKTK